MGYKYIILTLFIMSSIFLHAEEKDSLDDILQKVGKKKPLNKLVPEKTKSKKESHFVFTDAYDSNGIGSKDKDEPNHKSKSRSYEYEDKSKFKFKFNSGSENSNFMNRQENAGGGGAGMGAGAGRR